jgi:hypothetical protein
MQVVKAGALYFALVFAVGFVLGASRTLWVVPRLGTRMAELMEMPIMLAVTIVVARWTVLRLSVHWLGLSSWEPQQHFTSPNAATNGYAWV